MVSGGSAARAHLPESLSEHFGGEVVASPYLPPIICGPVMGPVKKRCVVVDGPVGHTSVHCDRGPRAWVGVRRMCAFVCFTAAAATLCLLTCCLPRRNCLLSLHTRRTDTRETALCVSQQPGRPGLVDEVPSLVVVTRACRNAALRLRGWSARFAMKPLKPPKPLKPAGPLW